MRNAPPVSYPLGRSRFSARLLLFVWLLDGAAISLWWLQSQSPGWRHAAAWLLLAIVGACAAWHWWHGPRGMLEWDGENWNCSIEQAVHTGAVEVSLDMQRWLLLRWRSGDVSRWFWLERAARAERWDDLRRAVYSRARPQTPPEARRLTAKP